MSIRSVILTSLAAGAAALSLAGPAGAIEMRPYLTLDVVQRMAQACFDRAAEEGWRMHVVIMDREGNLRYYAGMDDANPMSRDIAMMKATASAKFGRPTLALADSTYGNPERMPGPIAFIPGVVLFEGGLPIMSGDQPIGGIGVSGDTGANDAICAQAGLDAVAEDLQ